MILCSLACAVCGTPPETRVGPFLAALFSELQFPDTMPALSWAATAIRHGLNTAGELASAAAAAQSTSWERFIAFETLVAVGIPAGAVATVLAGLRAKLCEVQTGPSSAEAAEQSDGAEIQPPPKRPRTCDREMREQVLPNELTALGTLLQRLRRTISEYEHCLGKVAAGAGGYEKWKQRRVTWTYWNYCELMHLRQLEAVAVALQEADGAFLPMRRLFEIAWLIHPEGSHVRRRTGQMYSDFFAPWILRNLAPAVQDYRHQKGVAGHHHGQHYFYMCPTSASSATNLKASYATLLEGAEARSVEARLHSLPVKDYLGLLPSHATQRVLRSLLAHICESKSFLHSKFGFSVASLERSKSSVDLALGLSAKLEQIGSVRSDLTVRGQRSVYLQSVKEAKLAALADEHAGGWTSINERCAAAGIILKDVIEESANELGEFDYEHCAGAVLSGTPMDGGSTAVGPDRASRIMSTQMLRSENATWANLNKLVNLKLGKVGATLHLADSTMRLACVARYQRSRDGLRHAQGDDAAQVGSHKISSQSDSWHIDMHASHAQVALFAHC